MTDPFTEPAQVLLEQLRTWKTGAYNCRETPGSWQADCIACGNHRSLRIDEPRPGGRVFIHCTTGCLPARIGQALDRAVDHADPWAHIEMWEQLVEEHSELVASLLDLVDRLTHTDTPVVA